MTTNRTITSEWNLIAYGIHRGVITVDVDMTTGLPTTRAQVRDAFGFNDLMSFSVRVEPENGGVCLYVTRTQDNQFVGTMRRFYVD